MPITKSAKKALRQNRTKRSFNLKRKNEMKSMIKEFRTLVSNSKKAEAEAILSKVYKTIDKAAKRGIIKDNTASRKKSRLTKSLNKIDQVAAKNLR
ncbi:MAG: 30S ribosomal protein S20 [bacterium]